MMPFRLWASLAGVVAVLGLLTWSHSHAYRAGQQAERTAILNRSVEILRERAETDDEIRNMDSYQLCLSLGGLPDECAGIGM